MIHCFLSAGFFSPGKITGLCQVMLLGVLLVLAPLLPAQETAATEPLRLSPDEAVSLAIKNNLSLKKAEITIDTLKRKSDLSWNQFIPGVTVGGSIGLSHEMYKATTTQQGLMAVPGSVVSGTNIYNQVTPYERSFSVDVNSTRGTLGGQIQVSLALNAAMFEAMNILRLAYERGELGLENAKIQMEREIRKSYNTMLLLQEQTALLKESYDAANRQVAIAQANYNAGLAPELTLLQARVSRENMRPQIEQAENGIKIAMARFADTLGLSYDTALELIQVKTDGDFISFDVADLVQKASSKKPEIQELRQDILTLESQRKAKKMQLTPSLTLSWTGSQTFMQDAWKENWFEPNNWRGANQLSLGLSWKLDSLLPWSSPSQSILDTDADIRSKNIDIAMAIRSTEIEIYNIVMTLERTRLSAETQQQAINLAERTTTLTEQAYRAGLQDFLQVQNAVLALRQARVSKLEQQFNYLNDLINLEYAIGVPFGTLSARSE